MYWMARTTNPASQGETAWKLVRWIVLLYVLPAPLEDDLHLVYEAVFTRFCAVGRFTPLRHPVMHHAFLEPGCSGPPQYAILPNGQVHP